MNPVLITLAPTPLLKFDAPKLLPLSCRASSIYERLKIKYTPSLPPLSRFGLKETSPTDGLILVLGAGGVVGRALVKELSQNGYASHLLTVNNRYHLDLREPGAMMVFDSIASRISMVYFLACEVGGSKYLWGTKVDQQRYVWASNEAMYAEVIGFLRIHPKIKVLFSSSQLSDQPTTYGQMKKRGEQLITTLKQGRSLRFWNVVGGEPIGIKSHVLSDWASQCHAGVRPIRSLTPGTETRQFIHSSEAARGLRSMMENFDLLADITPITSGTWHSLRELADALQSVNPNCQVDFMHSTTAIGMERIGAEKRKADFTSPFFTKWNTSMPLSSIAKLTLDYYQALGQTGNEPYVTIILRNNGGINEGRLNQWMENYFKSLGNDPILVELLLLTNSRNKWCSKVKCVQEEIEAKPRGDFVLTINDDNVFPTPDAIAFLIQRKLLDNTVYFTQVRAQKCEARHRRVSLFQPNRKLLPLPAARMDLKIGEVFLNLGCDERKARLGVKTSLNQDCDVAPGWTLLSRSLWEQGLLNLPSDISAVMLGDEGIKWNIQGTAR